MASAPQLGPDAALAQREAALQQAIAAAQALPAQGGDAKARKDQMIAELQRQQAALAKERQLRERYRQLTQESVDDPAPPIYHPIDWVQWKLRESARASERKDIQNQINAMHDPAQKLYGLGDLGNQWIGCAANWIENEIKRVNKLVKVEFLNGHVDADPTGKSDPILSGIGNQWVNLDAYRTRFERKDLPAWLASFDGQTVESFDRLSRRARVIVEFEHPGVEEFWIKLLPSNAHADYSATEKTYASYHPTPTDANNLATFLHGTTDADGKAVVEVRVRAAGGDQWYVYGLDDYATTVVGGGQLYTRRGLFVGTFTMDGVANVGIGNAKAEWQRHEVWLETAEMTYPPAIGPVPYKRFMYADDARFEPEVQVMRGLVQPRFDQGTLKGARTSELLPYLVTTLFYDMSPEPTDYSITTAPKPPATAYTIRTPRYIWDPSDAAVDWFRSGRVEVTNPDGTVVTYSVNKSHLTLIGDDPTGYVGFTFAPGTIVDNATSVVFRIDYRGVEGGVNGFSSGQQGNGSFIAICRRHSYHNRAETEMNQTIVHELGHKISFTTGPEVATALPVQPNQGAANSRYFRWLDGSAFHYVRRGHQGGHCFYDAIPEDDSGNPTGPAATVHQASFSNYAGLCVMFGAGNDRRLIQFCPTCTPKLRKIDLEQGWTGL